MTGTAGTIRRAPAADPMAGELTVYLWRDSRMAEQRIRSIPIKEDNAWRLPGDAVHHEKACSPDLFGENGQRSGISPSSEYLLGKEQVQPKYDRR